MDTPAGIRATRGRILLGLFLYGDVHGKAVNELDANNRPIFTLPASGRRKNSADVSKNEALIASAAPYVSRSLRMDMEKHSYRQPDGLVAILVDDTLFAGTDGFRSEEQ